MKRNEKEAILKMAEELYESAVEKMKDELNWGFGVCDIDLIKEETEYIKDLQYLATQVENIEDDELEDWDITDFDLKFLKSDFPFDDLEEMVEDENIAKEIWDAIYAKAEVSA